MKKISTSNFIRILLNSAFVAFVLFAAAANNDQKLPLVFVIIYNLLLFVPAWLNNFFLLPALRRNKNLPKYLLAALSILLLSVFILGNYLVWIFTTYEIDTLDHLTPFAVISEAPESLKSMQHYFDVLPGFLLVMAAMIIGFAGQQFFWKLNTDKRIKSEHAAAELRLLKSQVSPHFLFNVLNTLYSLSLKQAQQTPEVILKLSDILRYSLYEAQEKKISILDELHVLKTYLDIEQLRIPKTAQISFEDDIKNNSVKIAPMLLLPLVENAFKHGIESTLESSYIHIYLHCDEDAIVFTCKNNYKANLSRDVGGIGIENIQKRLHLLYPSRHKFETEQTNGHFQVYLKILNT